MRRRVGPWTVNAERVVYENPWITVIDHDVTHPNGEGGQYGVVRFANLAIGVLAVEDDGMIPLVGQHRFPHDAYSWEVPEGGGLRGVDPLVSAKRELAEETGFTAADWLSIAEFDLSNSVTDERSICYLAWNLSPGAASPDPSEVFAYDRISFSKLHDRVLSGDIRDSLTIVMTLKTKALADAGKLPVELTALLST